MAATNPQGVDQSGRRKWNKEDYAPKETEFSPDLQKDLDAAGWTKKGGRGPPVHRAPLKARDYEIDLEAKLGKTEMISTQLGAGASPGAGGYYCDVCKCTMKDSANYLDHINGKKHQHALGMSMKTERATVDSVRAKLQKRKEPQEDTDVLERLKRAKEEDEERKEKMKQDKKLKKQQEKEKEGKKLEELKKDVAPEPLPDDLAMMGLPMGFSSAKTK